MLLKIMVLKFKTELRDNLFAQEEIFPRNISNIL